MNLPTYSQQDPRWSAKKLGPTDLTMGGFGCYVTTTASILAGAYDKRGPSGAMLTPGDLCDKLNAIKDGFDAFGQMSWTAVHELFPDCFLYKATWTTNAQFPGTAKITVEKAINDIRRAMMLGFPVGICVDNFPRDGRPDHIVACTSFPEELSRMRIMDPDGGQEMFFIDKYGSPLLGIMGYRLLIGDSPTKSYVSGDRVEVSGALLNSMAVGVWKASQVYQGISMGTYSKEILDSILGG